MESHSLNDAALESGTERTAEKNKDCPYCGKLFESKMEVVNHVVKEHSDHGLKKAQLKAKLRLAVVGTEFPSDKKKKSPFKDTQTINERKEKLGKPMGKGFEEEVKRQTYLQYGDKIRPQKPKDEDFGKIISAARQKISDMRTDIEHQHKIEFFQTPKDPQFRGASLVEYQGKKYWKYWLLNAKQTNGNGWGVASSTVDTNIYDFIDMPFVVTAQSWIPNSIYEDQFTHPYIQTNNLKQIYAHQNNYAVGTIRKIIKDSRDDYYAMIEPYTRFSMMNPPPFCSPGIYQLDRHEPANNISKWKALHLAGLMLDPAYGAQVATLKGTCVGTEHECFVQFRGAKLALEASMYPQTICPIRRAKKQELKQKLAGIQRLAGDAYFIHPNGKMEAVNSHEEEARDAGFGHGKYDVDISGYMKKTGKVRVNTEFNGLQVQTRTPVTMPQLKTLKDIHNNYSYRGFHYDVDGDDKTEAQFSDFVNTLRKHSFHPAQIQTLKSRLSKLGNMNITAVDMSVKTPADKERVRNLFKKVKVKRAALEKSPSKIPSFDDAKLTYNKVKHQLSHEQGFTFVPHMNRAFGAPEGKELHKIFGNGKDPLHAIAVTDEPGKELNENHEKAYNDLIKEGKTPTIGGYHDDSTGKDYTDIGTIRPMSDFEAKLEMTRYKQRSSGRYDLDGKFSIFNNE